MAAREGEFVAGIMARVWIKWKREERGGSCRGEHGDWDLGLDVQRRGGW